MPRREYATKICVVWPELVPRVEPDEIVAESAAVTAWMLSVPLVMVELRRGI